MLLIFFSLVPIFLIFFIIFILKKSSIFTGIIACFVTIMIAISPLFHTSVSTLHIPIFKSSLTTLIVAYILFFGILLYQIMDKAGSINRISSFFMEYIEDRVYQILILALGLSSLIEAVSGFGLAIIVIAPILMALGFTPFQSSLISLISLCIIPWGTLAMGTIIGSTLGNIPLDKLGMGSALMCIPIYIYFAILVTCIGVGKQVLKQRFIEVVFIGFLLGASVWICNRFISVELAGLFGSLTVISYILLIMKIKNRNTSTLKKQNNFQFMKDIMPYLLLIILLFTSRIVPPIKNNLSSTLNISIEKYNFELSLLYSPGFFLIIVCLVTILVFRLNKTEFLDSIKLTIQKCFPVLLTTFLFVMVSETMDLANMIQIISSFTANLFGDLFIFIAPFIGAAGGFLTGSITASNTMFIRFEIETAQQIGISPIITACVQNVSSALMTMVNPSRVTLSCTVTKNREMENMIQKKIAYVGMGTLTIIFTELFIIYLL